LKQIEQFKDNVLPTLWAELKMNPPNTANTMLFALMNKGILNYAGNFPLIGKMIDPATFSKLSESGRANEAIKGYLQRKKQPLFSSIAQSTVRTEDNNEDITKFLEEIPPSARNKILQSTEIDTGGFE
jgi:hypothetical protein